MRTKKNLLFIAAALVACAVIVWFSASSRAIEKTYEIQPYVTSDYKTDAARAIDAYERLMERQMDMTEANLIGVNTNLKDIVNKLDSINAKLENLSARISGIEKALGIKPPEQSTVKPAQPDAPQKQPLDKSTPPVAQ